MPTTPLVEIYARYVPRLVIGYALQHPVPITAPHAEPFPGAVLFADISGFTRLTEQLARRGPVGAEVLTGILNDYFGRMIEQVDGQGGDVVKFAGDALIAVWPATDDMTLVTAVRRATACGLAIQDTLRDYRAGEEIVLSLRVSVGAGQIVTGHLGGVFKRWEFFIAGAPLAQVGATDDRASPGDVVVSPRAWTLLAPYAVASPLGQGVMRVEHLQTLPPLCVRRPPLGEHLKDTLRDYLPGAILHRLAAGQTGHWLGELRRVTVIFINLPGVDHRTPLALAQEIMCRLQTALYRFEGSINKISVDDKGVTLISALGLPPLAHEDDAVRGVKAALAMRAVLAELNLRSAVGVTTGRVYCGAVGGDLRREYTLVGDTINLAARLMKVHDGDGILCDAATYEASRHEVTYASLTTVRVKGKVGKVSVHRPLAAKRRAAPAADGALHGRAIECKLLRGRLEALLAGGSGGVIVLEGEAGMGKSSIVGYLLQEARKRTQTVYFGDADAVEKTTPYYAWQSVFAELLDCDGTLDLNERRARVARYLALGSGLVHLGPLLNSLLPLALPDTPLTAQMVGEVRAANTERLLVRLLQIAIRRGGPLVLVLEDAHWLDSASWSLVLRVSQQVRPLLLLLALRPLSPVEQPEACRQLLAGPGADRLTLEPLSAAATLTLAARRLGLAQLPEPAAALIRERAGGHPLFAEELALALRDTGLLAATDAAALAALDLPDTIEGILITRIDRLTPAQQLTLKVASVIGRTFTLAVLQAVYPLVRDAGDLVSHLAGLAALGVEPLTAETSDAQYSFKHLTTCTVAYGLMLHSQRSELHRRVAEWYEAQHHADLSLYYPLLAHHWGSAGVADKAVDYLERAAEQALNSHASADAVALLEQALAKAARLGNVTALRRARWARMLGEAEWSRGQGPAARAHLEQALTLLGWPVPTGRVALWRALARQSQRQFSRRLRVKPMPAAEPLRQRLLEAALACEWLSLIYYFNAEIERFFYITLCATNLAERIGTVTPVLARSYATLALGMGGIPWASQAQYYRGLALQAAREVDQWRTRSWYWLMIGTYQAGLGRWPAALAKFRRGLTLAERLGDQRRRHEHLASLGTLIGICGNGADSERYFSELASVAARAGDIQAQGWGLLGRARILCTEARWPELADALVDARRLLVAQPQRIDPLTRLDYHALSAQQALQEEQLAAAAEALTQAVQLLDQIGRPTQYHTLIAAVCLFDAALRLWQQQTATAKATTGATQVRRLLRYLALFSRIFAIGRPAYWVAYGRYVLWRGKHAQALTAWRRSLAAAEELTMPHAEAHACLLLADHLPPGHPEQRRFRERAQNLLLSESARCLKAVN